MHAQLCTQGPNPKSGCGLCFVVRPVHHRLLRRKMNCSTPVSQFLGVQQKPKEQRSTCPSLLDSFRHFTVGWLAEIPTNVHVSGLRAQSIVPSSLARVRGRWNVYTSENFASILLNRYAAGTLALAGFPADELFTPSTSVRRQSFAWFGHGR